MKTFLTKFLIGCVVIIGLVSVRARSAAANSDAQPATPSVIRIAPVAPIFDNQTRLAELAARRARVAEAVGSKGILILFSTEPRVYTNDVDYEYRQENNLYYLTSLKQNNATLVMLPGNAQLPEVLFMPRRNPAAETWTGHMYSAEEASQLSGIKEIWEASEFEPFLRALRNRQPYRPKPEHILMSSIAPAESPSMSGYEKLFAAVAKNEGELYLLVPGEGESREYKREQRFASDWAKSASGFSIKNITPVFDSMRLKKSPMEIAFMQHAMDITTEAHERAWVAAATAKWEYEVDALVAYTFKLRNADHWGYPSIVGCGPNATTLHYEESQGPVTPGNLILMDVGAEYEHYSADVTRTFPVNGRFSTTQAEIYQIVYDAQEAAAKTTRPGMLISDVHRAATEVIKNGLLKLGLITDRESNQYRIWFMHGTSHWLGMNVHDVGNYGTRLEPGMVFTNEPGIYVRPDAFDNKPSTMSDADWDKFKTAVRPAYEKYKGIGVRIEDDLLVTPDGVKWMTGALPRKISDIEAFIAKARAEQRQNGN
ncbi:MAG TPA: aminopeptidase P family protein [Pyrinomonadaceae bacterium]|nr:aminopeptidase P family protein [Pyrinomonadaceae bacterium]